jgi:predicted Zn-dependent protease
MTVLPSSLAPAARVAALSTLALAAACATNPVTGKRQLALVSEAQEIQMGQQASQEVAQTLGLIDDPGLQAFVNRVGKKLAADSERPSLPWEFHVVDDPTPNAFALPGGFIYVTRGMMTLMTSEAQLASVLGHEIGHVTARHSVTQISQQQLAQLGLGLGSIFSPAVQQLSSALGAGLQLLFLRHGRDDERQADELGFRYIRTHNYDVREFGKVFQSLERTTESAGGSPVPAWLSTHPEPGERVETAAARAATVGPQAGAEVGREAFLRELDEIVYGENPRNGFFREQAFYHPDLRFQLRFPEGWRTQNTPQAVVAVAPQGAAVFQLTLSPVSGASEALRQFAAQQGQGVQIGNAGTVSVNGLPATTAEFAAQTEQGVIQGRVAFLEHDGRTYQLLGYTAAQTYAAAASTLEAIIGSFARLTDPAILAVQPNRVAVVPVRRTETLAEWAQDTPSAIPVEELAIINQLPGPSATVEAGTLLKRVTPRS